MENADGVNEDFYQLRNRIEKQFESRIQKSHNTWGSAKNYYSEPIISPIPPVKKNVNKTYSCQNNERSVSSGNNVNSEINFKVSGRTFSKLMEIIRNKHIKEQNNTTTIFDTIYDYLPSDVLLININVKSLNNFPTFHSAENEPIFIKDHVNESRETRRDFNSVSTFSVNDEEKICTPKYHPLLCELVESEYGYVGGLHNCYHNYILYFKRESHRNLSEIYPFFTIIEQINCDQAQFYKELMTYKSIEDITSHFLENEKLFALYRNYFLNVYEAIRFLTLEHRFEVLKRQQELRGTTTLEEHLLSPIQRINTYISILERVEAQLQDSWTLTSKVTAVLLMFRKLLNTSNADRKIVNSIIDRPLSLVNYGGFIMQESFFVRKISSSFKIVVFLFQESVVFTIPKDYERYTFAHSICMKDLYIRQISTVEHSFELMDFHNRKNDNERDVYILETGDSTIKNKWVEVIESLLWEQLMICKSRVKDRAKMI